MRFSKKSSFIELSEVLEEFYAKLQVHTFGRF